jgi:polyisoprenoid-binding protein YceI
MRRFAVLFSLLCGTLPASAAGWKVDYKKSSVGFLVQWSNEPYAAVFKSWSAIIDFDPAHLSEARVTVTIDVASELSNSPDLDEGVKGTEGFGIVRFPYATFVCTRFVHKHGNEFLAQGQLTIKGQTRGIALPFSLDVRGNFAHAQGSAQVGRADFGLGVGASAESLPVSPIVTVKFDLHATRSQ